MADERFKEGLQEYIKPYGYDPFEWNKWSAQVLKFEKKKLSMLLVALIIILSLLGAISFQVFNLEFNEQSWLISKISGGLATIFWLIFWLKAFAELKSIDSPGKHFVTSCPTYCKRRIQSKPLLIISVVLFIFSLVNLTYDSSSGLVVKIIMTVLITFAVYMIVAQLVFSSYGYLISECRHKLDEYKNMQKEVSEKL